MDIVTLQSSMYKIGRFLFGNIQRVQINRLMEKGIITSYSLSADRGTLWVTLLATSLEAVEKTLRMMPLFKFMRYDIIELMFHNSPVHAQMHFSMN